MTTKSTQEQSGRQDDLNWERYEHILNILTVPVLLLDEKGNLKYFNDSTHLLTGFVKDDLGESLPITDLLSEKDDSVERIMEKINSVKPGSIITKILTKNGIYIPVELSISPLADPSSTGKVFLVQISDIRSHLELEHKESLLTAALNSSLEGMALLDRRLNINLINDSFAEMLDARKDRLTGINIFELPHQVLSEMEKKNFLYMLKQSGIWKGIITTGLKNNKPRQIEIGIYRIKSDNSEVDSGFIALSRDVTTAEEQNSRIRTLSVHLKEYSKQIIKAMAGATLESALKNICTELANISEFEDIKIILFNSIKPYYDIHSSGELSDDDQPPVDKENHPKSFVNQIKNHERIGTKIYSQTITDSKSEEDKKKHRLWILLTNEFEKPVGCITLISPSKPFEEQIISLDVFSVQFSLFLQIINLQKTLNLSKKEMENFIYSISHDLKTPVMAIVGFSEILRQKSDNRLSEEEIHCLTRIEANVTLINTMVNSLLELSRAGKILTEEDKKLSVEEVVDSARKKIEEKFKTSISLTIDSGMPTIQYDLKGLSNIFYHLIENAVKFKRKNVESDLHIGFINRKEDYVFFVKDNGTGIPQKGKERIFEPFFRLCPKDIEGIGIGLAIVQRIVEARGGNVWFDSIEGEGSTFFFSVGRK